MVDLPSIPQRLVTTEAPKSAVTAADVAAPSKWLADAFERIGTTAEDVGVVLADQAGKEAGQKEVTIGPDGKPNVEFMPILSGKIGAAYNKAALAGYETKQFPKMSEAVTKAQMDFDGKPDEFAKWFQDYSAQTLANQPDVARPAIEKRLSVLGQEAQNHLIIQRHHRDVQADNAATDTELKNTADDLELISRNGGTGTPGYDLRMQRLDELLAKKVANPAIAFPKEKAEEFRNAVITRAIGGSVLDGVERVYNEQGYEAARGHLRDAVTEVRGQGIAGDNPEATGKYGLKMRDLDKIERQGLQWLRTEDAGMRGARDAISKEWNEAKKQVSTLPTETLIEMELRAESMGAVRTAADIRATRASLDIVKGLRNVPVEQRAGILSSGMVPVTPSAKGAVDFFTSKGWTPEQAAGIVGNLVHESNLNPNQTHDGGIGLGIAGWNKERLVALKDFAASRGKQANDYQTQLEFVDHELRTSESAAGDAVRAARTPQEAAAAFLHYERPLGYNAGNVGLAHGFSNRVGLAGAIASGTSVDLTQSREGLQAMRILKTEMGRDLTKRIDDWNSADKKLALPSTVEIVQLGAMAHAVGTPEQQKRVAELAAQSEYGQDFAKLSAPKRAEAIASWDARLKAGGEKYERELRDKITEANGHISEAYKKDPYGAYYRYAEGAQALPSLDITQPDAGDIVKAKETQRAQIMAQEGIPSFSVMRPAEAKAFRGLLYSNDPNQVAQAASFAANMLNRDPNAFVGVDGKEQIEKDAVTFQHYVDDLGMSAPQAAGQIVATRQPEYKTQVKTRFKSEDVNEFIKKEVSPSDLAGAFDRVPIIPFTDPIVTFTPEQRQTVFSSYAELVRDFYLDNGNIGLSKKLAANQMKNTYGVTDISGRGVMMAYPPEKQPQLAGIDNAADLIASQAISSIKQETGTDVKRGDLVILPVPGATSAAFRSGQPAPYQLGWFDSNRVLHWTDPGRAFVVDAKTLRDQQTMEREKSFRNREQAIEDAKPYFAGVQ